ncbi:MAG: enoyl-CoA hydratase-related protein [bacterium]|nr:enoyl-CoA hydratase-related protein [bacterium]
MDQIIIEKSDDSLLTILLNRPDMVNALNLPLAQALTKSLKRAAQDPAIRAVVLRGSGGTFSAGGDLKFMKEHRKESKKNFLEISQYLNEAVKSITAMPKPVVAAVEGHAYAAGFGLAISCDMVVAKTSAMLSPSFLNIALSPNAGTTYFLPRILGPKRAMEAFIRAQAFTATEAHHVGMVNHVWEDSLFDDNLKELTDDLIRRPSQSLGRVKKLMNQTYQASLTDQLALERKEIAASSTSEDFEEGVTAFVEKRRPIFNGK